MDRRNFLVASSEYALSALGLPDRDSTTPKTRSVCTPPQANTSWNSPAPSGCSPSLHAPEHLTTAPAPLCVPVRSLRPIRPGVRLERAPRTGRMRTMPVRPQVDKGRGPVAHLPPSGS